MQRYDQQMQYKSLATWYQPRRHVPVYQTIQQSIEWYSINNNNPRPLDCCSAICILLLVCFRGFGTADIHGMSNIIKDLIDQRTRDNCTIRHQLWEFCIKLGLQDMQFSDLLLHVGLYGNTATFPNCTVMVQRNGSASGVPCKVPFTGMVNEGLIVCGGVVCPGWACCAFHKKRLLAPEGIQYGVPIPDYPIHMEDVPRPVATIFKTLPF